MQINITSTTTTRTRTFHTTRFAVYWDAVAYSKSALVHVLSVCQLNISDCMLDLGCNVTHGYTSGRYYRTGVARQNLIRIETRREPCFLQHLRVVKLGVKPGRLGELYPNYSRPWCVPCRSCLNYRKFERPRLWKKRFELVYRNIIRVCKTTVFALMFSKTECLCIDDNVCVG
ncbi:hypothetical protein RF11_15291 [Thelohanellus kitauei]|uniref:Uncharacterized protein n=1 Tax=Thelohanellus kitauei TaxID=669202 RepID=A0A0C2JIP2_THEKT|nr:hypothetical protein RF11_15291 [Thelohanellus kitauei]